jgi:hypothetical protein
MNRKIQLFKDNTLYVFEFPLTYNTNICEQIILKSIEIYKKSNKPIHHCKKEATKIIFRKFFMNS